MNRTVGVALGAALAVGAVLAACSDAAPDVADAAPPAEAGPFDCGYPSAPYGVSTGDVVADLLRVDGVSGQPVRLSQLRRCGEPTAPRLIALRVVAEFCGTCRWSAEHTSELLVDGVQWIDVLVRGTEGAPPTLADAARWNARRGAVDVPTWLDPEVTFAAADPTLTLPLFVYVDPRTMAIRSLQTNPEGDAAAERVRQTLAELSGAARQPPSQFPRYDGAFSRTEWDQIQAMAQPADFAPPADPTDVHADDPRAAALGKRLFADPTLSPSGTVSCQTCHDPARGFADGLHVAHGVADGPRNTQSLLFAAHQKWQFWDGRADTLWAQALGPLENELEFDSSRLFVVHRIFDAYRTDFESVYGALPDPTALPPSGKPGDPAWDALPEAERTGVTRAFTFVGKAIAAYERTLRAEDSPLDRYARGDTTALTPPQKVGLQAFLSSGCTQCHYGPRLTDDAFHVVRFPTGRADGVADVGRSAGLGLYAAAEFGAATKYSDAVSTRPEQLALLAEPLLVGQFKTPSLRGVAATAPYGHGGSELDAEAVATLYGEAALDAGDPRAVGSTEPWIAHFDTGTQHDIAAFLQTLTAVPKQ